VSDHFEHTDNTMTPKQRETGFSQMIEAVLNI
jgi:purine-nucleoside phosphorylase